VIKKGRNSIGAMAVCLITITACAQEREEVPTQLTSISKEVRMEIEDGVKTMTITTTENGTKTEEVFVGDAAEAKMEEINSGTGTETTTLPDGESMEETIEIDVTEVDGVSVVTIVSTVGGVETIEVYQGAEADKKLEELAEGAGAELEGGEKKTIVKKRKDMTIERVDK
jgi:hypothetical protein